jgi:hypothetical protein
MRNTLIEQAQYLVETDQMAPLDYLHALNEINSLSEEELIELVESDLIDALAEGSITDEEFDLMLDEFENIDLDESSAQEVNDDNDEFDMQRNEIPNGETPDGFKKQKEEVVDDIGEDLEVDEGVPGMIEVGNRGRRSSSERRYVDVYPNDYNGYGMQEDSELDENYAQDVGDEAGMQECDKCK